jgi:hypothetical protein
LDSEDNTTGFTDAIGIWYEMYCVPAWKRLASPSLDADERQTLRYRLYCTACDIETRLGPEEQAAAYFTRVLEQLSEPPQGPLSAAMQARMAFQVRCRANGRGAPELSCAEGAAVLGKLPEWVKDPELWHFTAGWAFSHGCAAVIEEALGYLTVDSQGFQSDFIWQRVYLMHLLLGHRAARRDVVELLKRILTVHQWRAVKDHLWPACVSAGLVDEELEQALARRLDEIGRQPLAAPALEDPTKRIRKDL